MIQDLLDHGGSKKPMNPLWSRIYRLLMHHDLSDLGSSKSNVPKLILHHLSVHASIHPWNCPWNHPLLRLCINLFHFPYIVPCIHPFLCHGSIHTFLFVHQGIHPLLHLFIHRSFRPLFYESTNRSIHSINQLII